MSDKSGNGKEIVIVLRCPFCDSLCILQGRHAATTKYWVKCSDCGAIGPSGYTQQDALGKWNKRRYCSGTTEFGEIERYAYFGKGIK